MCDAIEGNPLQESKNLNVAVTGHEGFIGNNLVALLESESPHSIIRLRGDVCCPQTWNESFDCVVHLGAVSPATFGKNEGRGFLVNVGGVIQALEACKYQSARLVFASTCGVYRGTSGAAIREDGLLEPNSSYAYSKHVAEMICKEYCDANDITCTILRLFNVYGCGQQIDFLIPYLMRCALTGKEAFLSEPDSIRDLVHVKDVAAAFAKAITPTRGFGVYNIGTGVPTTVRAAAEAVECSTGRELNWRRDAEDNQSDSTAYVADMSLARDLLHWAPTVNLEQGLVQISREAIESPNGD